MSSRQDSARNPKYFVPYTLDLGTLANTSQAPSQNGAEGEIPANVFDCRFQRGMSFQLNTSAISGSATVEPQWSIDGVNWESFSTTVPFTATYSLVISGVGTNGYTFTNPWFPWLRFIVLSAASSGNVNIFSSMRN